VASEEYNVKKALLLLAVQLILWGCAAPPRGIPDLVQATADRYLAAWQRGDWDLVYRLEGRTPDRKPLLHLALTDSLAFYTINEVRYSDSAAACAVTLQWQIGGRPVAEAGDLYLVRRGTQWRISGFRSF